MADFITLATEFADAAIQYTSLPTLTQAGLCEVDFLVIDAFRGGPFAQAELDALAGYVRGGGTVMAMVGMTTDCPASQQTAVNELASTFGVHVTNAYCGVYAPNCIAHPMSGGAPLVAGVAQFENCYETGRIDSSLAPGAIVLAEDGYGEVLSFLPRGSFGAGQVLLHLNYHAFADPEIGVGGRMRNEHNAQLLLNLVSSAMQQPQSCVVDWDDDGVVDELDLCAATRIDTPVDDSGCSGAQLVELLAPCDEAWDNHGEYLSAVAHAADAAVHAGLLTNEEADTIVSAAARSACGK